jgi:D-aminopeptidase
MITYDFKGGTSSASRRVEIEGERYTVGILVQSNFGRRRDLTILGVPVGQHITEDQLRGKECAAAAASAEAPGTARAAGARTYRNNRRQWLGRYLSGFLHCKC